MMPMLSTEHSIFCCFFFCFSGRHRPCRVCCTWAFDITCSNWLWSGIFIKFGWIFNYAPWWLRCASRYHVAQSVETVILGTVYFLYFFYTNFLLLFLFEQTRCCSHVRFLLPFNFAASRAFIPFFKWLDSHDAFRSQTHRLRIDSFITSVPCFRSDECTAIQNSYTKPLLGSLR